MIRRLIIGGLLSMASLVVVLLLMEIILRLVVPPMPHTEGNIHQASKNPKLVYELRPNSKGVFLGAAVSINSFGLRDVEYTREKPHGVFRIVILGDSWTFGTGVTLEETYAKQLEAQLNKSGSRKFQVMNAGIGGSNIVRAVELLKTKALLEYSPDLVIVGYNIHNVELAHQYVSATANSPHSQGQAKLQVEYVGPRYGPIPYGFIFYLKERFYTANFLGYGLETVLKQMSVRDWSRMYREDYEGWVRTRQALSELADLTSNRGIPVMVAMFPVLINFKDDYPWMPVHKTIQREVEARRMYFVNITGEFSGVNSRALWVHPQDRHPNAQGHALLAEGILKALLSYGLVTKS